MKKQKSNANKKYIQQVIDVLNAAFSADPKAVSVLFKVRVPCNTKLADHPTIVVKAHGDAPNESFSLGALGLLNGVLGTLFGERVAMQVKGKGDKLTGFCAYGKPLPVPAPLPKKQRLKQLTPALRKLAPAHGTPKEFAVAVRKVIGEISVAEAERAIRVYNKEWHRACKA